MQLRKEVKNYYNGISSNFFGVIKYLHIIQITVEQFCLDKEAIKILKHHNQYSRDNAMKQYIKKFKYIYFAEDAYYNQYKSLHYTYDIDIDSIAVINLYLVTKLKKAEGIYFLIKYLYI